MAELEETLKKLMSHKGVIGYIVINNEGIPIRSTMDNPITVQYTAKASLLVQKAREAVKEIETANDLTFLRIRSKKHEIMIAPDKEYMLLVVQDPASVKK